MIFFIFDLRLVSYFLRKSPYIRASYLIGSDRHKADNSHPLIPNEMTPVVYIKSGRLVDPFGIIATALLRSSMCSYPMSSSPLRLIPGSTIPTNLFFAAFNAAIVGISTESLSDRCEHQSSFHQHVALVLRKGRIGSGDDDSSDLRMNIAVHNPCPLCSESEDLLPSIGLGIVRAVDLANKLYHIIHPIELNPELNEETNVISLTKGYMQLPAVLLLTNLQSLSPYVTSDTVGEGSGIKATRSNVKRRSYNK